MKDPYKYFRIEAKELLEGLTQGTLALEKGADKDKINQLFRLAHTLKGASRVVKQAKMAEVAHAIEDVLSPYRENYKTPDSTAISTLLQHFDALSAELRALGGNGDAAPSTETQSTAVPATSPARAQNDGVTHPETSEQTFETVRVEVTELDAILETLTEASVQVGSLHAEAAALERALELANGLVSQLAPRPFGGTSRGAADMQRDRMRASAQQLCAILERFTQQGQPSIQRAATELSEVREKAHGLRMLAVQTIVPTLERAVRDAASTLGKRVEFATVGSDIKLDGHVLLAARDALLHLVRNAVAHGIETVHERLSKGKSEMGRITLTVERLGHRVRFSCRDDGEGIDVQSVRLHAVERRIISAEEAARLSAADVLNLLFMPGMSTTRQVTEVSGRGVGLDVVKTIASRFKGDFSIHTNPGLGTTIELTVPISLATLPSLAVEAAGLTITIPLDSVRQTLRLVSTDLVHVGEQRCVLVGGQPVPFIPVEQVLRGAGGHEVVQRRVWTVVIVRGAGLEAALGVDRLLGTRDVVVRPLPALAGRSRLIAGASLDANGDPLLLLDPAGWAERVRNTVSAIEPAQPEQRAPILVIDDSLTTRMLEQSILEAAGYDVDVATSAEEALSKAEGRRYGLFVCDVEMPGMSGFDFAARTRGHSDFSSIPVVLVTSLNSAEDRKRGSDSGAAAYIVKGEFDQGKLLDVVQNLMRQA